MGTRPSTATTTHVWLCPAYTHEAERHQTDASCGSGAGGTQRGAHSQEARIWNAGGGADLACRCLGRDSEGVGVRAAHVCGGQAQQVNATASKPQGIQYQR